MRQVISISMLVLAGAVMVAAQNDSPIVRERGYWTRTMQGTINVSGARGLRVETTGNVQLHGTRDPQAKYVMKLRVRARNEREAEALLHDFSVKTGTEGGWTYIRVTP